MKKRVVITGMEICSSIGTGIDQFWQAASKGVSGIKRIDYYDPSRYPCQIAGQITNFSLEDFPEFNKPNRYPRVAQFALFCANNAIKQSGITTEELRTAGTYMGTSVGGQPELESAYEAFYHDSYKKVPALTVLRGMPNSVANHVAIAFGIKGPNTTISNACLSSAEAIGAAYQQITRGQLSTAICGGTESLLWETVMAAWCKLRVLSSYNEDPASACRPFDSTRNGMVMAEGAGIIVLEELEQAKARGAKILGEIIGYGASCDASHITAPCVEGQVRAIHMAMDDARTSPQDIQYINAHGTGTELNDITETETIKTYFGKHAYDIPITAQKSMTGHTIGAAGVLEIIATILSLNNGLLLPTINLHNPDPACDLDYIPNVARKKNIDLALSNHFAFGGANAALILRKYI